jgi:hypothetical protein
MSRAFNAYDYERVLYSCTVIRLYRRALRRAASGSPRTLHRAVDGSGGRVLCLMPIPTPAGHHGRSILPIHRWKALIEADILVTVTHFRHKVSWILAPRIAPQS